jgi:RNA polymerase sigma-32 factor
MSEDKFHIITPETSFVQYVNSIRAIPSLDPEEEYMLAKRYQEYGDLNSAHKLVTSHLKLVVKIASTYKGYGLPMIELVSEGNIGLMQAVKKFDPERGFRLSTYAMWWIKASIQEYILKSWSLVKIGTTSNQKKLFFNLGKVKKRIHMLEQRDFSPEDYEQAAKELNVEKGELAEMVVRMNPDAYLDAPIRSSSSGSYDSPKQLFEVIPSADSNTENRIASLSDYKYKKALFYKALESLNEREKEILFKRKMQEEPATLDDLSKEYNISKERVRQIESKAIEKLTKLVQKEQE